MLSLIWKSALCDKTMEYQSLRTWRFKHTCRHQPQLNPKFDLAQWQQRGLPGALTSLLPAYLNRDKSEVRCEGTAATIFYPFYPWEGLPGGVGQTKDMGFFLRWSKFESCASLAAPAVVLEYCCCFVRIENGGMLCLASWLGLETKAAAPNRCQWKV
jgi:hypothetical protein